MSEKALRISIGTALVAALVGIVLADRAMSYPLLGTVVLLLITLVGQRELVAILRGGPRPIGLPLSLVTIGLFAVQAWLHRGGPEGGAPPGTLFPVLAFSALAVFETFRLQSGREPDLEAHAADLGAGAAGLLYVAMPMGLLQVLALDAAGHGTQLVATYVLISKCGDIGGYLAGSMIGRHRVMPRVSPKKSWEGSIAGLLLTVLAGWLFWRSHPDFFPGLGPGGIVIFCVVVNVATQLGDFAESMVKRSRGVKDSGRLLPTFGGALDIIDSLVFALPAAALVLWLLG
ncbi:MAG: phosphatidate cytidylyltransferase [Planctomycetota bacterium]